MSSGPRRKSPLADDLRILVLGVWGFLLQCIESWQTPGHGDDA
jgi:hypothetical protein